MANPGARYPLPWWRTPWALGIMLLGLGVLVMVVFLWGESSRILQTKTLGPVTLIGDLAGVEVRINHPLRLRMASGEDDLAREIIVTVEHSLTETQVITVCLVPESDALRLLSEEGDETDRIPIRADPGIPTSAALTVKATNAVPAAMWQEIASFDVLFILPGKSQSDPIEGLSFSIEVEGTIQKLLRDTAAALPQWQPLVIALLTALIVKAGSEWWTRWTKSRSVFDQMQRHINAGQMEEARRDYNTYERLVLPPLFRNRPLEKTYQEAEARFAYGQALKALRVDNVPGALSYLSQAQKQWWDGLEDARVLTGLLEAYQAGQLRQCLNQLGDKVKPLLPFLLDASSLLPEIREALRADTPLTSVLYATLRDRASPAQRRRHVIQVLKGPGDPKVKKAVTKALNEDLDVGVQIEAAWAFTTRRPRPAAVALQSAVEEIMTAWLGSLPTPLLYNPFRAATAEEDERLDSHFVEFPGYQRLLGFRSVALFADSGAGKTAGRIMVARRYLRQQPDVLVAEYLDFTPLFSDPGTISVASHIQAILQVATGSLAKALAVRTHRLAGLPQAEWPHLKYFLETYQGPTAWTRLGGLLSKWLPEVKPQELLEVHEEGALGGLLEILDEQDRKSVRLLIELLACQPKAPCPQNASPLRWLNSFMDLLRSLGYEALAVMADNVDGYAQTQADPALLEPLLRNLVGDVNLLEVPGLHFKLFLPLEARRLLRRYAGFATGRIETVEVEWSESLLYQALELRLWQARRDAPMEFPSPEMLERQHLLRELAGEQFPQDFDIDRALVQRARGSPRRLVRLADALLQHRARIWWELGQAEKQRWLTIEDWAVLLEHLLRQDRAQAWM